MVGKSARRADVSPFVPEQQREPAGRTKAAQCFHSCGQHEEDVEAARWSGSPVILFPCVCVCVFKFPYLPILADRGGVIEGNGTSDDVLQPLRQPLHHDDTRSERKLPARAVTHGPHNSTI